MYVISEEYVPCFVILCSFVISFISAIHKKVTLHTLSLHSLHFYPLPMDANIIDSRLDPYHSNVSFFSSTQQVLSALSTAWWIRWNRIYLTHLGSRTHLTESWLTFVRLSPGRISVYRGSFTQTTFAVRNTNNLHWEISNCPHDKRQPRFVSFNWLVNDRSELLMPLLSIIVAICFLWHRGSVPNAHISICIFLICHCQISQQYKVG